MHEAEHSHRRCENEEGAQQIAPCREGRGGNLDEEKDSGKSAPAQDSLASLKVGCGGMSDHLYQTPEGNHVHQPRRQLAGYGFLSAANAPQQVRGKKNKHPNLKRLQRPGILNKNRCRAKGQIKQQARAYDYRRTAVGRDRRFTQSGIRANGYDWQCDHCIPNCCLDCKFVPPENAYRNPALYWYIFLARFGPGGGTLDSCSIPVLRTICVRFS